LSQKKPKSNILVHQGSLSWLQSQKSSILTKNPPDGAGDDEGRNKVKEKIDGKSPRKQQVQ
jgi:hypothetical protein